MTPPMMEEDRSHMTDRILNLTLEIIYLLTGESFHLLKSGDHVTITLSPCDSLKPERPNMEKIVEATKRMMELLTGEGEDLRDFKVEVKEEEETLVSGDQQSMEEGGPLYSQDSTQEDLTIPHHDQNGTRSDSKADVKEEIKEEDDGVMEEFLRKHKDLYQENMEESSSYRNPPERCLRPLYSQDPTQEDLTIPHHDQGEDLMKMKVEGEVEETYVRDDQRYTEEAGMRRTSIEEDTPTEISTVHGRDVGKISEERLALSPEDEDITQYCPGEDHNVHQVPHSVDGPSYSSYPEDPQTGRGGAILPTDKRFPCAECGKSFHFNFELNVHKRCHSDEKPYSCPECGKCFSQASYLSIHKLSHTGEKLYSCPECRKIFAKKSDLDGHQKSYCDTKPYSCSECGKRFSQRCHLFIHQRSHTGEKPFSCTECGRSFTAHHCLTEHQRCHTGEKPYPCPECRKCFSRKSHVSRHLKSHTGEKPYSCPECMKCFARKSHVSRHVRSHTGEKPYSCTVCGKGFSQKSSAIEHQRTHTAPKAN